ncbi:DUF5330 domain-containing protein [Fulvimarina sp. MAC3]|uniref:DUF5330 domain-containing protein n=1 Tax=Fulvimarina sp. MAC3 TaxID=3148887 RepID=UPI0031FC5A77
MIRFLLKTAFVIGIGSLFIPGLGSDDGDVTLDPFQSFMGFRAAVEDVMGFCTRAPEACEAGSQLGQFALGRVESGFSVALDAASSGGFQDKPVENPVLSNRPDQPKIDWSSIDPALIRELLEAVDDDQIPGAQQIPPDIVKAVRRAADLAARGEPLDAGIVERFDRVTVNQGTQKEPGSMAVPTPRPRPAL